MRLPAASGLFVLTLLAMPMGCMNADEKADIELICDISNRSGAKDETDPSQRAAKMASYLKKNLKSQRWIKWFPSAASKPLAIRQQELKDAAADAGLSSCPFADEK